MPVEWQRVLSELAEEGLTEADFSPEVGGQLGLLRAAVCAFRRPDGSVAFSEEPAAASGVRAAARGTECTSLAARTDVLAAVRDEASGRGHLIAIDHTQRGTCTGVEMYSGGVRWLESIDATGGHASAMAGARASWLKWHSCPEADVAEWRIRCPGMAIHRVLVWLRGRKLGLILEEWVGGPEGRPALVLETGVADDVLPASPQGGYVFGRKQAARATLQVLPIGVTAGSAVQVRAEQGGGRLVLTSHESGRRALAPVLFSTDAKRNQREPFWRLLTISELHRVVRPDVARAYRVGWSGQTSSLVIYRSLSAPARRAFLGYQTSARLLIGTFDRKGQMEPIVQLD